MNPETHMDPDAQMNPQAQMSQSPDQDRTTQHGATQQSQLTPQGGPMQQGQAGVLRLLFICTANQCRSPLAEVMARDQLERRGIRAEVASAGFLEGGVPAARGSQKAAARRGLDLSSHRSRRVTADMVENADVAITMEPDHVLRLTEEVPESRNWSLTLKELARHAGNHPSSVAVRSGSAPMTAPVEAPVDQIRGWVRAAANRDLLSLLGADNLIKDPMGRSDRAFRATAKEIDGYLSILFDTWFGAEHG